MYLTDDLMMYIVSTATNISRLNGKVAIYNGHLYVLSVDGLLYHIDLETDIDKSLELGFDLGNIVPSIREFLEKDNNITRSLPIERISYHRVIDAANNLLYDLNSHPEIYRDDNLRADKVFEEMTQSKAADGAFRYFYIDNRNRKSFILLTKNIFNLSSKDTAEVRINDSHMPNIRVAHFIIHKKKLRKPYDIYFRFMDL